MSEPSANNSEKLSGQNKEKEPDRRGHAPEGEESYGYDLYPDRFGREKKTVAQEFFSGRRYGRQFNCLANVYRCIQTGTTVQLLLGALQSHGCPFKVSRHVACEECLARVNGGYDPVTNQIVVCQNNSKSNSVACSVLAHELIHMFDACRAEVDFKNIEHLACTEIRAANFMHCSFLSAWSSGSASPINIKNQHRECVRQKALTSVLMTRDISKAEGEAAVDKVFEKCYNDMEPLGRRPSDGKHAMDKARIDAYQYGYQDWLPFEKQTKK